MSKEISSCCISSDNHEKYMKFAFDFANEALKVGEVPIGCVIVFQEQVIGTGRNYVNDTKNATKHAEIVAIDEVQNWCKEKGLNAEDVFKNCSLYVTVEPCVMCASAVEQLNIPFVLFGCANERFGGCGSVLNVFKLLNNTTTVINSGMNSSEAIDLLKAFYQCENPNAPNPKAKIPKQNLTD